MLSVCVANSGSPSVSETATGCCLCCWRWWQKMWVCAWWRLNFHHLVQQKEHQHTTLLIWMCKTRQRGSSTKQIRYGFKALQVMCCLLTFILSYYHSLSPGENDNALGFKALRRAQHLRVLTFLVLIGWIACSGSSLKLAQQHWKPKQAWLENHWKASYLVCISHHEIDSGPHNFKWYRTVPFRQYYFFP